MTQIDLLKVSYDRIVGTNMVTLTDDNYEQYGYQKDSEGYYKIDEEYNEKVYNKLGYEEVDVTQHFEHILPNPSKFSPTYSDVDKEGSGRNESNGQMTRERIGYYQSFDVTWDIVPNSSEGINLMRILRALPPSFQLEYYDSDNDHSETKTGTFYHGDISCDLYLFTRESQIWKGITTSFIQYDVTPYDDGVEPELY